MKSEGKLFQICLKNMFSKFLVFHSFLCVNRPYNICTTKRFPHRLERQKNTKIGEKIGEEIGEKIGHCYFCNGSKMHHLGVTQPDYQTL